MTNKWILLTLCALIKSTKPSIDGVTYRGHFDFEERYSNPNECNPFYWHPLHLPQRCAEVFEKAIRSKISRFGPVRIKSPPPLKRKILQPRRGHRKISHHHRDNVWEHDDAPDQMIAIPWASSFAGYDGYVSVEVNNMEETRPLGMYGQMMNQLRQDISNFPSAPIITALPGFGPVALYQQPISKISKSMIENTAKIYQKIHRQEQPQYPYYQSEIYLKEDDTKADESTVTTTDSVTKAVEMLEIPNFR